MDQCLHPGKAWPLDAIARYAIGSQVRLALATAMCGESGHTHSVETLVRIPPACVFHPVLPIQARTVEVCREGDGTVIIVACGRSTP